MKSLVGQTCKVHVIINRTDLYFRAYIKDVSLTHLTFIDKYNRQYSFRLCDVAEITVI